MNAGDVIMLTYNFLTNESTPSSSNDFGFVSLGTLLDELADTGASFLAAPWITGFLEQTGFSEFTIGVTASGTYILGLGVVDVGGVGGNSALVLGDPTIDGNGLVAAPSPLALVGLGLAGMAGLAWRRQRRLG